ncbi:MAG TPA: hypothetical protein VH061_01230 [Solirubrobacteraceae bacterium]|nr:hypothetical protein [Solirubrobacteraceae bacterium]
MDGRARRQARRPGNARGPQGTGSRVRLNRVLALAILAILALAALAPAGQASGPESSERAAQRAIQTAQHLAEREAVHLQREAIRTAKKEVKAVNKAERQAHELSREAVRLANKVSEHATVTIGCTQIVVKYTGFLAVPDSPNAVSEKVVFRQLPAPLLTFVFAPSIFGFDGTEATTTIPIAAPLGHSSVGIRGKFNSNGVKGSFNIREPLICGPNSQFTMQTTQSLGGPFTTEAIPGSVGETVDYQTVATNTGNTPLTFTGFSDPGCDSMPAGGSAGSIPPRGSITFVCTHRLTEADKTAGVFANAAGVTATPASGETPAVPILHTTAGVLVDPIGSGEEPSQPPVTTITKTVTNEITTSSVSTNAKSGVASSKTSSPSLRGPKKCFRGTFTASVTSPGVSNVTFYVDGHRVVRRTSHSTSNGLISIRINGAKLKAGVHRLLAKITMTPTSPTAKATTASRSMKIRRCATTTHHS